ncbi:fatty acid amide hydrolase-like isoform X2 [Camellia sinensis]|uniref:fatty acid amide hydrolase-like isoform X1 n=1 Tax=Camellia sinensis TaxID=4442 RepID=UPI0010366543|nr:fatty acid amide hydrolase-like isoform X1 [Camellia sinensis]XP_028083322.1 fatty acid amide hydrolase-like isoform X1 [Camellia sinensis]XP_028083323.1 fatty acid amide hydrolase-like isoform X2 [Camellia sinensis]
MGKKRVMVPANEVDLTAVKYEPEVIQAPHMAGVSLKLFVKLVEVPLIGSLIISYFKKQNKMSEILQSTVIPETPMFIPEFPPQEPEPAIVGLEEDGKPEDQVELALKCLPHYDAATCWTGNSTPSFRYWKIRDYAHAYRSRLANPSMVAERFISAMEEFSNKNPPAPLLVSFDAEEVRKQAAASTQRFEEGNPLSILDGIFMAIKDDIDCYPHRSKGATTWFHEVRPVRKDAVCVSRLRKCGVIFVGKANMHELGMGTTGNNPNYGSLCDAGTVEIIGPIASNVEDLMLVYATVLGSSPSDRISLRPSLPCLPNLSSHESSNALGALRLGKYTEWFNDVFSTDISQKCGNILKLLLEKHGCKTIEIVIPELHEMRMAHLVSIGSEALCGLAPVCEDGNGVKLTYDTRTNLALFQSFTASEYVAAQRIRRRIMYYHTEIFKKVDVIVTPTTGMTAPVIPREALACGETNLQVTGNLMRFIIAGNLLGLPAISVPVGYDKQGLPIGLQLIGRPWGEATILRLAAAVEELCAETKKKPMSFYDILKGN